MARAHNDPETAHFHYYLMRLTKKARVLSKGKKDGYQKIFSTGELVVEGNLLEPDTLDCMGADSYTVDTDRTALCLASEILTDPLSDRPVTLSLPRADDEEPDVLMLSDAGHERVMNTITG